MKNSELDALVVPAVNLVALLKLHRHPAADGGGWVSIQAVHAYGCPTTRWGKKHGPCNCSARRVHDELLAALAACDVKVPS